MNKFLEIYICILNIIFKLTSSIPIQPIYHDISILDEAVILHNNYNIFKNEVINIYKNFKTIQNDSFFTDLVYKSDWTRLYIKWHGDIDKSACKLCPKSCEIIEKLPNVKIAMFSVLKPGTKISRHNGYYRGCIRFHMGLITPNSHDCFISIDGKQYHWKDGESVLLDDTYEHYVENNTDEYRVILFCDIVRPMNIIGSLLNNVTMNTVCKYTHREN